MGLHMHLFLDTLYFASYWKHFVFVNCFLLGCNIGLDLVDKAMNFKLALSISSSIYKMFRLTGSLESWQLWWFYSGGTEPTRESWVKVCVALILCRFEERFLFQHVVCISS